MTKKNLMPVIVLSAICIAAALLLSVINIFTAEKIAQNRIEAEKKALQEVFPAGGDFTPLTITDNYPEVITGGYKFDTGFVFKAEVKGYSSGLIILIGVDNEGRITGVKHTASKETFGAETEFNNAYTDRKDSIDTVEMILSASASKGAPMTAKAYYDAIEAALNSATIAKGGLTPEQLLQNNCNVALGTTDKTFSRWFATEVLDGIDSVYVASDNSGYVFVVGESFIGVNASGEIVTDGAEAADKVTAAYNAIITSDPQQITTLPAGVTDKLVSVHKTASGNYILVTKGNGYGMSGGYQASGEPIVVKVSISSDGKILSSAVVSHNETENPGGAALENQEFHDQFIGSSDGSYSDINATGATATSNGYKDALSYAFDVFELLQTEGENQ